MPTEIESRYLVPDQALFNRLRRLDRWDGFTAQRRRTLKVVDYYLDTLGRALLRQGWACRLRSQNGLWVLTLKGPKDKAGAIISRAEHEIGLPARIEDPAHWPPGIIRTRVSELTGGLPLQGLVSIKQRRYRYLLRDDSRLVGELSLDVVRTVAASLHQRCFMLECELCETGELSDLERLDQLLSVDYGLIPEERSKLQRALELVEGGGSPDHDMGQAFSPVSPQTLVWRYGLDRQHADYIAALTMELGEKLAPAHELPQERWGLAQTAALLHNVGGAAAKGQRHIVSRDILLRQPIEGLEPGDQLVLAAAAYLHKGAVSPERVTEVLPLSLPEEVRRDAMTIAALVRLANALDTPREQRVGIKSIDVSDVARITLSGQGTAKAVQRASRAGDLWALVSHTPIVWQTPKVERQRQLIRNPVGLDPTDSMSLAAAKILRYHFQSMLEHEAGSRLGANIEELHDMRVATRRMRSALRLFGPFVRTPFLLRCNSGLRRAARALGKVRDMDVALTRVKEFRGNLAVEAQQELDEFIRDWMAKREYSRRLMIRYLDSQSYQVLLSNMRRMFASLECDQSGSASVGDVSPRLLYLDWCIVRAYGHILKGSPVELLHALRIDCKRLRYALEFFAEILPPQLIMAIPEVVALQDHLGEMRDATIAVEMIDSFGARRDTTSLAGIQAYRHACQTEMTRRLETFPRAWRRFSRIGIEKHLDDLLEQD